ncbi:HET-domain-containing protein [Stipitochalara longipes BDJ]|nr:HET-domain-containing protein [Stipitochalara longipes BDJ]
MRVAHPNIRSNLGLEAPLSYGRLLDPDWIDLSVARWWIYECEAKHGALCSQHGWDIALQKLESIRLINVEKMCLVEHLDMTSACRYVALSYKWSKAKVVLKYENRIEFMEEGGLRKVLDQIPRTIVDAMEVTMKLGERYLWVDALCIIQEAGDDEAKTHISMMDRVYSGALVTIVAAPDNTKEGGTDPGLKGVLRDNFVINSENEGTKREITQPSAEVRDGARIIAPFACRQQLITTAWNARAWTFQEKLLSRRLLVFSGDEVVWHCRQMIAREDMRNEDSGGTVKPLEWLNLKPKFFDRGTHSHWIDGSLKKDRHGRTHIVRSGTFAEYTKVIEEYTHRQLSFKYDIIRALEGMLQIFRRSFRSDFIYGLPKILLDIAILWKPSRRLRRRISENGSVFPSWSWAGWEGLVCYDDPMDIGRDSDGEVIGYRRSRDGEEGVRPLLKWYCWDEKTAKIEALNGHGRGIPLESSELPSEWDISRPNGLRPGIPDTTGLNLKIFHLIFHTMSVASFQLADIVIQNRSGQLLLEGGSSKWQADQVPHHFAIVDSWLRKIGSFVLDGEEPQRLEITRHEFILLAETQLLGLDVKEKLNGEFRYYLVMLVEKDSATGTYARCGLGRVSKEAWRLAEPVSKVIVLG